MEITAAAVAMNLLHAFGLAAPGTIWPLNVALLAGAVYSHPAVERRLLGGDRPTTAGIWRAMSVGAVICAAGNYLTGWGPMPASILWCWHR